MPHDDLREDARSDARERALALLYEAESKDAAPGEVLAGLPVPPAPMVTELVEGVEANRAELDDAHRRPRAQLEPRAHARHRPQPAPPGPLRAQGPA